MFIELVKTIRPNKIIDFGLMDGFSTISMAEGVIANGFGKIFAYDIFDKYPYNASNREVLELNLKKFGVADIVCVRNVNFHEWINSDDVEDFDLLHIDISNCGDIIRRAYNRLASKIETGSTVIFEGGSKERDLVEWMLEYNKVSINSVRDECSYEIICNEWPSISKMTLQKKGE